MGKTFEALERAEKEYETKAPVISIKPRDDTPGPPPRLESGLRATDCYEELKINLLSRYPEKSIKTILFSGTTHGDGSSTTAINFATTLARNCLLKVLLMEANFRTPSLHDVFHLEPDHGLSDLSDRREQPGCHFEERWRPRIFTW
jgi:Mrp family chromosome partitioning ATPase